MAEPSSKKLLNFLSRRPTLDRSVVEVLAVAYESLTRTELAAVLSKIGIRDSEGRRVGSGKLDPLLQSLAADGFVTYDPRIACVQQLREPLARKLVAELRFEELAAAVGSAAPMVWGKSGWGRAVREVRFAIHSSQPRDVFEPLDQCEKHYGNRDALAQCCQPLEEAWLDEIPQDVAIEVLTQVLRSSVPTFSPTGDTFALLDLELVPGPEMTVEQERVYIEQLLLRGAIDDTRDLLATGTHPAEAGVAALIGGDRDGALAHFERVPKPPGTKRRSWVIPGIAGVFHALALATSEHDSHLQRARQLVATATRDNVEHRDAYRQIEWLLRFRQHGIQDKDEWQRSSAFSPPWFHRGRPKYNVSLWIAALVTHWTQKNLPADVVEWLEGAVVRAKEADYDWIAFELAELLARSNRRWRTRASAMRKELEADVRPLVDLLWIKPAWERKLELLSTITAPLSAPRKKEKAEGKGQDARLVWLVSVEHGWLDVEPRHQTRNATGLWSKGRKVALKRLFERDPELDFLTDLDRRLCAKVECHQSPGWGRHMDVSYTIGGIDTYRLLAEHPALFASADDPTPVDLVFTKPHLIVEATEKDVRVSMHPENARGEYQVVEDGPYRIEICELTEAQSKVAELLDGKLVVPAAARDRVQTVVAALAPVITVQSDVVPVGDAGESHPVEAKARLHLRLTRRVDCLEARLRALPLGTTGPACVPGRGQPLVVAQIDGRRLRTERNLEEERRGLEGLCARCPSLESASVGPADWRFEGIDSALDFLLELSQFDDDGVVVAWSTEDRFDVTPELDEASLYLTMRSVAQGFSFDGELRVKGGRPAPLSEVLGLLAESPARYLELGDGRFLALTDTFRRRLAHLARYRREGRGKTPTLPTLAVRAIQPLIDAAGKVYTDAPWREQVARMQAAEALDVSVPSTLKAQLRPYQEEGVRWMARLAACGAGACLADDMGLGKTVQALALVLMRATQGPTLVVAPTSVCGTWLAETARFAPTLSVVQLGEGDRSSVLEAVGPQDVVLISYGLLHNEADRLAQVDWTTVILDEAQAIKNPRTKRFEAAIRLGGGFRLATTGTPIENRLEELWSLFQFINPGLLGSHGGFTQRFGLPIERDGNREARASLRKLVQPFILRRNKSQVLDELPARTDIDVRLDMSEAEAALYEAQRQQALSDLAGSDLSGFEAMRVFAWITTLRRTCCNPRLTVHDHAPPSCKLAAFIEIVEQLRGSGHKALVFSQFVDHLTILREWLDAQGIAYQYLDGRTSKRDRSGRIAAFQAGEGDLFLISLRAGGLGLNLTVADHVIHMDPWWNPAVEDQASDRAHRIGQQRPVTVYRLIVRDTIEERIVALHRHKRSIAEQLLRGADITGRLSTEELLALLQEN